MSFFLWPFFIGFTACASAPPQDFSSTANDGFTVKYQEFQPSEKKAVPRTVVIFPPTGGVTYIEKAYAKAMAKRGATVKVIETWTDLPNPGIALSLHQKLHERAMRALKMIHATIPRGHKVSLLGTSLGGIYAAVATHQFDFMDRVFVIAAGSSIPKIIAFSEHDSMTPLRKQRKEKFGFPDNAAYAAAIDEVFFLDPSDRPEGSKGKTLGMAISLKDKAVPTEFQEDLKNLWNPTKIIPINAGHFWSIVTTWASHKNEIAKFLVPENARRQ